MPGSEDRIVAVTEGGVIWQSAFDNARTEVAAPREKVWMAPAAAYGEMGILPTVADADAGLYGNRVFTMPSRMRDKPATAYFDCGIGIGGTPRAMGRVTANVQKQIAAVPGGGTSLEAHVKGTVRSTEGTSNKPLTCGSTGAMERLLHVAVQKRLLP